LGVLKVKSTNISRPHADQPDQPGAAVIRVLVTSEQHRALDRSLCCLFSCFQWPRLWVLCLQLLNDGLTFAGAMLLNLLVQHLDQATGSSSGGTSNYTGSNVTSSTAGCCGNGVTTGSNTTSIVAAAGGLSGVVNVTWQGISTACCSFAANSSSRAGQDGMAAALAGNSPQHGLSGVEGGVGWLPGPGSPGWGFVLAAALGLSAVAKAVIGSHYNYGLSLVTVR
jgi:hypothetical protein